MCFRMSVALKTLRWAARSPDSQNAKTSQDGLRAFHVRERKNQLAGTLSGGEQRCLLWVEL